MKPLIHHSRVFAAAQIGKALFRTQDQYGEIVVSQRAGKRLLSFGSSMEQSCVYMDKPYYLAHEYGQAMLLGLIYVDAKHITLLGLGAGGMLSCLNHFFKDTTIAAIELRQIVIDVAYEWFNLPKSSNLQVDKYDAFQYMLEQPVNSTDLIMSDLYDNAGMSDLQLQQDFLAQCYEVLTEKGCLVLNFHADPDSELSLMKALSELFSSINICRDVNGNCILFCLKQVDEFDEKSLQEYALKLAKQVQMPLMYYYRQLSVLS